MIRALVAAAVLGAAGCPGQPSGDHGAAGPAAANPSASPGAAHPSAPTGQEPQTMDDPLRALDRHPGAVVTIRYGTEHFGKGLITLRLHGDGRAEVDQLAAGKPAHDELRLTAAQVATLGQRLADHKLTAPRTTTLPRQPGDTELHLALDGAGPAFSIQLWYADRYKDPDLDAILQVADEVIHDVTAGRLGYRP